MSRTKHLVILVFRLLFLVLVCATTMVMLSMQTYKTDQIPIAKNFGEKSIDIFTENGATVTYEIVGDEIVFDINQSGESFDDIMVFLTFDKANYDASFMRSMLGDNAKEYEEYISQMENGPWLGHCNFVLKGESFFTTSKGQYTFADAALTEYVEGISSSKANTTVTTESFDVKKDEKIMVALVFGSEAGGALENGKYTLKADLKLLHPEGKQLDMNFYEKAGVFLKFAAQAVSEAGFGIFNVTNWLTFYGVLVILGWFIYLWRDIRSMAKIFCALLEGDGTTVIVKVYINGIFSEEYTTTNGGNIAFALIITLICYLIFIITTPIRMLIHIVRDIIYLIKEDDEIEGFSFLGNILGSAGIYSLIVGITGLFGAGVLIGGIATAIGIALCIAAHFICKHREEEYG